MSEPEIARRCLSCGASVRERATFCPQCGQLLEKKPPEEEPIDVPSEPVDETVEVNVEEQPAPEPSPETAVTQAIVMPSDITPPTVPTVMETQPLITQTIRRDPTVLDQPDGASAHTVADASAQPAESNLLDRVDRIRKVSSVMIDQAAYDPSLRFLLVAAVLFIIFVVLMILSKVIG